MPRPSFLRSLARRAGRECVDWVRSSLPALAFIIAFRVGVVDAFHVPTGSMRPTIVEGDRFFGAKFAYWFAEPEAGDIVVFRPPANARAVVGPGVPRLVKRIVAVEGDLVEVSSGVLRVNGAAKNEPYVEEPPTYTMRPVRVPDDCVFVLGDNRNNSADGHYWGFLPRSDIKARLFARYWPIGRIGAIG